METCQSNLTSSLNNAQQFGTSEMESDPVIAGGKKTIFVGNLAGAVNEQQLIDAFTTFGDIVEVAIPPDPAKPGEHRGFAFITFSSAVDAQDAIDNYDLNELPGYVGQGKVLKVNVAKPDNKAREMRGDRAVWQTEEWLQEHAKPEGEVAGPGAGAQRKAPSGEGDVEMS